MRRLFWVALGATAGVIVARKVTRTIDAFTPQNIAANLAESLTILGDAVRDFALDVREGMREREIELVAALGLPDAQGRPPAIQGSVERDGAGAPTGGPEES